ncbi:cyclic AMP-responsive element-binding protein 5-like [Salvia splendens]|uniref:cyclic AMP-responsive element-binding protein 5-like n=1 Tax=Salvia splendens TaxID=180675 RepID=UPI001C2655D8|nr:cyclic AMP-responsive element-binding protein 5-like [Salvia splendens]
MSSIYAAYYHHQFDYRQSQFAHHPSQPIYQPPHHHPSQPIYQPPHHHPSQPIYQPPHHPIGSLDLQQSYPQDRHFHPQYHPYQARQPTCWDPPWVRTQQSSSTYDQSPPHGPYLAYGEATYQGSGPNNPDFMARSFSPAQLAAVNDYNEKLRVYRLDQAALLARVTALFEENIDDKNLAEDVPDNVAHNGGVNLDVPNNESLEEVPNDESVEEIVKPNDESLVEIVKTNNMTPL